MPWKDTAFKKEYIVQLQNKYILITVEKTYFKERFAMMIIIMLYDWWKSFKKKKSKLVSIITDFFKSYCYKYANNFRVYIMTD